MKERISRNIIRAMQKHFEGKSTDVSCEGITLEKVVITQEQNFRREYDAAYEVLYCELAAHDGITQNGKAMLTTVWVKEGCPEEGEHEPSIFEVFGKRHGVTGACREMV